MYLYTIEYIKTSFIGELKKLNIKPHIYHEPKQYIHINTYKETQQNSNCSYL